MNIVVIKNKFHEIKLLDFGATIYEWIAFSDKTSIVMNNNDLNDYKIPSNGYFGATIGRVANRINNAQFSLDGITYNLEKNNSNKHNLHGGFNGFNLHKFEIVEKSETKVIFKMISDDMDSGFPGRVELYVTYELIDNVMLLSYKATTDKPTIINITNHAHFNLGDKNLLEHNLEINADRILDVDNELIPTGNYNKLDYSLLDFRKSKTMKDVLLPLENSLTNGLDHFYMFQEKNRGYVNLSFKNKNLKVETSYPGLQIYTMNQKFPQKALGGKDIPLWAAVALECQFEPDAINHRNFSNTILRPGKVYQNFIKYTLTEE